MNRTKKLLALLLCVVMCLSLFPVSAFAADEGPAGDAAEEAAMAEAPVDTAEEEEPGEPEEPEDPAAPADDAVDRDTEEGSDGTPAAPADGDGENGEPETPDDAAEPAEGGDGEADPAEEPAEGEENEDAEEAEDADEEEEEQKELPCGFAGMPEDYEFSGEELAAKRALTEKGVLASLKGGVRYEEGKLLLSTDSREYAELAAAAYNAELKSFNGHFAVLILTDATVAEAVEAAADMELPLPAVEPNWIVTVDPIIRSSGSGDAVSVQGLLDAQNWETWYSNTENPDEYLSYPFSDMYQYQHDMVNTYEAWGVTTGAAKYPVTVAVLDEFVDGSHDDLQSSVVGYIDELGTTVTAEEQHGTHVAGIIAGEMGNGDYGAGIAPNVNILAVRVLDEYTGSDQVIADGIYWAVDNGADIINMSLSGPGYSSVLQDAINYAYRNYVTVIVAMGNQGSNIKMYPAACDNVVAVGAVDATGARAGYSNYGAWCDVSAPGSDIWSTIPENEMDHYGIGMDCWDGTSMACPVVSGVAALYMSVYGNPGPAAMEKILKAAVNKGGGSGMGTGIIDASKLFSGEKGAPVVAVVDVSSYDDDDNPVYSRVTNGKVSNFGYIFVQSASGYTHENTRFLFTTDGKNPAVIGGNPVQGSWLFDADECYYEYTDIDGNPEGYGYFKLPLTGLEIGSTLTLKIMEVNGLGVASKVTTTKVQIVAPKEDELLDNIELRIEAPGSMIPGKSAVLKAKVVSTFYDANDEEVETLMPKQGVKWELQDEPEGIKIDPKSGKLTVGKNTGGMEFTVTATSTEYDWVSESVTIEVDARNPIGKISFSYWDDYAEEYMPVTSMDSYMGYYYALPEIIVQDIYGSVVDLDVETELQWSNSKPAVATVEYMSFGDEFSGYVVLAKSKGTTTLKLSALDGSGKSATLKIKANISAQSISITGPTVIAPGGTGKYSGTVFPKDAANKKLFWYLGDEEGYRTEIDGVSINSSTGVVKVDNDQDLCGTHFTVCAGPWQGPWDWDPDHMISYCCPVVIDQKATGVAWEVESPVDYIVDKKGALTGITIYSTDFPYTDENEAEAYSWAWRLGVEVEYYFDGITATSKTPSVATVEYDDSDESWVIRAQKAGTTTITFAANDGSGKKASMTVQVLNPVSYLNVRSQNPVAFSSKDNTDYYGLGFGKSAANTVSFGDTYGVPSNKNVFWSVRVYDVSFDDDLIVDRLEELDEDEYSGEIFVDKNGKLTVKKGTVYDDWNNYVYDDVLVEVIATSTDRTEAKGIARYIMCTPPTKIIPGTNKLTLSLENEYDAHYCPIGSYWWIPIYENGYRTYFTATTSKPDIAGARIAYGEWTVDENNEPYCLYDGPVVRIYPDGKTGTAKITVKTVDGSNKSCSISVKVTK